MGWHRRSVVGELMYFWDETQERGIVDTTRDEIALHLTVETDGEASTFIDALLSCGLLTVNPDGSIHISGNGDHVLRLDEIKEARSKGGKKRASSAGRAGGRFTSSPGGNQQRTSSAPAGAGKSTSSSPAHTSSASVYIGNNEEHLASLDAAAASPPAAEVVEKSVNGVIQIQQKFRALYAEWYPLKPDYDWDYKRDGNHAKSLLERNRVEDIIGELEAYFGWKNPQLISDGHTFSHGRSAFIMLRRQLNADMGAPQRHDVAAVLRQENYQRGKVAYERKLIGS